MSEANDIVAAIYLQLCESDTLSYMHTIDSYCDEIELEDAGCFPFLNIDIRDFRVEEAPTHNLKHMERRIYPIILTFANRHLVKKYIKSGYTDESFKGLFDIYDDIRTVILTDRTFDDAVNSTVWTPTFASEVSQSLSGEFWTGRAGVVFEVYKDVNLV